MLLHLHCAATGAAAASVVAMPARQALRAFRLAGLIDHKGQWSGGDTVCVQVRNAAATVCTAVVGWF
jgi:hypothetical protein